MSNILGGEASGIGSSVEEGNDTGYVYVKGDATTEGSIRLIPDKSYGTELEVELLQNGVWNDTGLVVAASTIYLGRELRLSGGGEFLLTRDASEDLKALVPHMRLHQSDVSLGTEDYATVPILGTKIIQDVLSTGTSNTSSDDHELSWSVDRDALMDAFYVFIGSVAPVDEVTVELWRTSRDVTGNLFFTRNYPASTFGANSVVHVEEKEITEIRDGETIIIVLKSATAFDMRENFGDFYLAIDYWPLSFETAVTYETGLDGILTTQAGNTVIDSNGNLVTSGQGVN